MKIDYRRYKHPGVVFSMLGVTTLMLISVFFLDRAHNTHRWIHFGGFSFQPSEVAKVALILFLAFFLESRHQLHERLAKHVAARGPADADVSRPDRVSARPGHRHRLRRDYRVHPVRGRPRPALSGIRRSRRRCCRSIS